MKLVFGLALLSLLVSGCFNPKNALPVRNFDSTILPRMNRLYVPDSLPRYQLTHRDLHRVERVLKLAFDQKIVPHRNDETANKSLKKYARQYYGYRNPQGDRCAFVQCVLKSRLESVDKTYWRQNCFFMDDGGDSVFRVWINLDTDTYERFETNFWG